MKVLRKNWNFNNNGETQSFHTQKNTEDTNWLKSQ